MSGIAGVIRWDEARVDKADLQKMLDVISHRGPDGLHAEVDGSVGFGAARYVLNPAEWDEKQPIWLPDHSYGVVADARLYNRTELLTELGQAGEAGKSLTDAGIILAGYERWGADLVDRLDGDFAFGIWDSRRHELFAARDPFGVKPFFYRSTPAGFCFGSEPKQLLLALEGRIAVDPGSVVEFLLGSVSAGKRTFFQDVSRLEAGSCLRVREGFLETNRYWNPGSGISAPEGGDLSKQLRKLLRRAVAKRLDSERRMAIELSGGYDSTTIVILADEIAKNSVDVPVGPLVVSHTYEGFDCDESPYIEAISRVIDLEAVRIEVGDLDTLFDLGQVLREGDAPEVDIATPRARATRETLDRADAKVLLTGLGGDELFWEPDWVPDLVRQGRWLAAYRHSAKSADLEPDRGTWNRLVHSVWRLVPNSLRKARRAFKSRSKRVFPTWLSEEGRRIAAGQEKEAPRKPVELGSVGQEILLSWLTNPEFHWNLERAELYWAQLGKELRHPFLDKDLVQFVLSIPPSRRIVEPGKIKPLLRQAMQGTLPEAVMERDRKVVFDSYFNTVTADWRSRLASEIFEGDWASGGYTDREAALLFYDSQTIERDSRWEFSRQMWSLASLEVWLRQLRSQSTRTPKT